MEKPALAALDIGDPPERWRALGFSVDDQDHIALGDVELRLGAAGEGITAWAVTGVDALTLVPLTAPPPAPRSESQPNGATGIDHVVITTPDFDAAARALEEAGLPFRRVRRASPEIRQGFRRLGPAIMEVVEAPGSPGPAFWGLTVIVADFERLRAHAGAQLSEVRPAVQPGRKIATLSRAAGLCTRVAFMTPQ
ncbi:MAG: VOC family protein [Solirubrobacteraceae bacterium]